MKKFVLFVILLVSTAYQAMAQNKTWNGSISTAWETAGNWTPSGVPTATDQVSIVAATRQPIISTVLATRTNSIGIGLSASLTINNGGQLSTSGSTASVGMASTATFTINVGGVWTLKSGATSNGNLINFVNNGLLQLEGANTIGFDAPNPTTCTNNGTINITSGTSGFNAYMTTAFAFVNNGTITLSGTGAVLVAGDFNGSTFNNKGTINVGVNTTLNVVDELLNSTGTINNAGTITNDNIFTNNSVVSNTGTYSAGTTGTYSGTGAFTNSSAGKVLNSAAVDCVSLTNLTFVSTDGLQSQHGRNRLYELR
jgi:fibronectin-binding autotransporter adhesin